MRFHLLLTGNYTMLTIDDSSFEQLVAQVLDELPAKYTQTMNNIAIVYADEPAPAQRAELQLRCDQTLYGLYQGIPLPQRGMNYNLVLPDKITLFKLPLLASSRSGEELKMHLKHTLWHELAHHFGLGHARIHELETNRTSHESPR